MYSAGLLVLPGTSSKKTGLLFERYREKSLRRDVPENLRGLVRGLVTTVSIDTDVAVPDVPLSGDDEIDAVELVHRMHLELPAHDHLATEPGMVEDLELPADHLNLSSPQVAARGCPRIAASYLRRERSHVRRLLKESLSQVLQAIRRAIPVVRVQDRTIHVAVVAGLPGGTASGSVRMICELVTEVAAELGVRNQVLITLFTVASGAESAVNDERARANTFAQLGELYADSQRGRQSFDWCFVVGPHDGKGGIVGWDQTFQILAQVLHLLLCTEAGPAIVGRLGDAEALRLAHDSKCGTGKIFSSVGFSRLLLPDLRIYFGARLGCAVLHRHLAPAPTPEQSDDAARQNLRRLRLLAGGQGLRRELLQELDGQGVTRSLLDRVDETWQQVEGQRLPADMAVSLRPTRLANAVEHCRRVLEENELQLFDELTWGANAQILRPLDRGDHGLGEACSIVKRMLTLLESRVEELQEGLQALEDRRAQERYRARTLRERLLAVLNDEHGPAVRQLGTRPLNAATAAAERSHALLEVEALSLQAELRLLEDVQEHLTSSLALLEDLRASYQEVSTALQGQADRERSRSHAFELANGVDLAGNPDDHDTLYERFLTTRDEDEAVRQVLRQYGGLPPAEAGVLRGACEALFRAHFSAQEEFLTRYPEPGRLEENLTNLASLSREILEINECRVDLPGSDANRTSRLHFVGLSGGVQGPLGRDLARVLGRRGAQTFLLDHGSDSTVDVLTVRVGLPPVAIPLLEECRKSYVLQMARDLESGSVLSHTGRYEHLLMPLLPEPGAAQRATAMGFALGRLYLNGSYRWRTGAGDVKLGSTPDEAAQALASRHGALAGVAAEFVEQARQPGGTQALARHLLAVEQQHPWLAAQARALLTEL